MAKGIFSLGDGSESIFDETRRCLLEPRNISSAESGLVLLIPLAFIVGTDTWRPRIEEELKVSYCIKISHYIKWGCLSSNNYFRYIRNYISLYRRRWNLNYLLNCLLFCCLSFVYQLTVASIIFFVWTFSFFFYDSEVFVLLSKNSQFPQETQKGLLELFFLWTEIENKIRFNTLTQFLLFGLYFLT